MTTWHGDGIYSKARTDGDGKAFEQYFVRVFVAGKVRVFKAGRTLKSAERERIRVLNDPAKAVEKREQQAQDARDGLTVAHLYKMYVTGRSVFHANVLKAIKEAIGSMRVSDLTVATFDSYFRKRKTEVGQSTLRKEVIVAAAMLKWGRQRELHAVHVLDDYEKPREPGGAPARALTFEEEDKVLAFMPPLEADLTAWLFDTGMRYTEGRLITWRQIDRAAGVVHVTSRKGNKVRTRRVPLNLSNRLTEILERHPRRIGTDLLFHDTDGKPLDRDKLNGLFEAACKAAGIELPKGTLWNATRKTAENRMFESGLLPQVTCDIIGHSLAVSDRHYREHQSGRRPETAGALNRLTTVAGTVAGNSRSAESLGGR